MTLFSGCTLFAPDGRLIPNGALLVDGDRIVASGPRADVATQAGPSAGDAVDLGGRFVLPGLVDAHVHLHFPSRSPGGFPLALTEHLEYTVLRAAANARSYLAAGVTAVMDCGTRGNTAAALRDAVANGLLPGPRIVASGVPLSPTGGWADGHPSFVVNQYPDGAVADTPDEWRRAVREQVKAGADNIKIGISGSALSPYSDPRRTDMDEDLIALVVGEAHRLGASVAGHCHSTDGLVGAVRAGIDTVHHGHHLEKEAVAALADSDTYYVPTAIKLVALVDEGAAHGRPPAVLARLAAARDGFLEFLRYAVDAGLGPRIAVGSDAGNLPPPHGSTARELPILVAAGMSPAQALLSATSVAARAIGLGTELGELRPGQRADFLAVAGDPLADVSVLTDPARLAVYQGGRLVADGGVPLA